MGAYRPPISGMKVSETEAVADFGAEAIEFPAARTIAAAGPPTKWAGPPDRSRSEVKGILEFIFVICACLSGGEDSAVAGIQIGSPWMLQIVLFIGTIDAKLLCGTQQRPLRIYVL